MINFIRSLLIINRIHIHIYIKKNRTNQVTHPVSPNQATIHFYTLRNLMLQVRVSSYLFPRTRPNNIIYLGMILYIY